MNRNYVKRAGLWLPAANVCRMNPAFLGGSARRPSGGGGGGGGWTKIASVSAGSPDGNGFTTTPINTTGASLIVIVVTYYTSSRPNPTDSASNTYPHAVSGDSQSGVPGSDSQISIFRCASPSTSGAHTFTVPGSSLYPAIAVYAFSGGAGGILDQTNNTQSANAGSGLQAGSITPSTANQLIVTGITTRTYIPTGIDLGFATPEVVSYVNGQREGMGASYLVQGAAAAVNPTWSISGNDFAAAVIASFK